MLYLQCFQRRGALGASCRSLLISSSEPSLAQAVQEREGERVAGMSGAESSLLRMG